MGDNEAPGEISKPIVDIQLTSLAIERWTTKKILGLKFMRPMK